MQPLNTTHIRADNDITIELLPTSWTLVRNEGISGGRTLFAAEQNGEIRYAADFATSRKLPVDGLPADAVRQVLLGWSPRLSAWQLGFLFSSNFADQRGSRWLELARWYDPDGTRHSLTANRAGSALARVMSLHFKVIAPRLDDQEVATPPKPLPDLPLSIGDWALEREGDDLLLARQGSWTRTRIQRIVWYGFWILAYTAVSILSLTVKLGLPNAGTLLPLPHLLPFMGLLVVVALLYLLIKNILELVRTPSRMRVSSATHEISALRGDSVIWTLAGRKVMGVYVSEVAQQRRMKRLLQHTEINLMMNAEGDFTHVLASEKEQEVAVHVELRKDGAIEPLLQNDVQTPAQAAALYIAQALGDLPSYLDQRIS